MCLCLYYCLLIGITFDYYGIKISTVVVKHSVGVQDKLTHHEKIVLYMKEK